MIVIHLFISLSLHLIICGPIIIFELQKLIISIDNTCKKLTIIFDQHFVEDFFDILWPF